MIMNVDGAASNIVVAMSRSLHSRVNSFAEGLSSHLPKGVAKTSLGGGASLDKELEKLPLDSPKPRLKGGRQSSKSKLKASSEHLPTKKKSLGKPKSAKAEKGSEARPVAPKRKAKSFKIEKSTIAVDDKQQQQQQQQQPPPLVRRKSSGAKVRTSKTEKATEEEQQTNQKATADNKTVERKPRSEKKRADKSVERKPRSDNKNIGRRGKSLERRGKSVERRRGKSEERRSKSVERRGKSVERKKRTDKSVEPKKRTDKSVERKRRTDKSVERRQRPDKSGERKNGKHRLNSDTSSKTFESLSITSESVGSAQKKPLESKSEHDRNDKRRSALSSTKEKSKSSKKLKSKMEARDSKSDTTASKSDSTASKSDASELPTATTRQGRSSRTLKKDAGAKAKARKRSSSRKNKKDKASTGNDGKSSPTDASTPSETENATKPSISTGATERITSEQSAVVDGTATPTECSKPADDGKPAAETAEDTETIGSASQNGPTSAEQGAKQPSESSKAANPIKPALDSPVTATAAVASPNNKKGKKRDDSKHGKKPVRKSKSKIKDEKSSSTSTTENTKSSDVTSTAVAKVDETKSEKSKSEDGGEETSPKEAPKDTASRPNDLLERQQGKIRLSISSVEVSVDAGDNPDSDHSDVSVQLSITMDRSKNRDSTKPMSRPERSMSVRSTQTIQSTVSIGSKVLNGKKGRRRSSSKRKAVLKATKSNEFDELVQAAARRRFSVCPTQMNGDKLTLMPTACDVSKDGDESLDGKSKLMEQLMSGGENSDFKAHKLLSRTRGIQRTSSNTSYKRKTQAKNPNPPIPIPEKEKDKGKSDSLRNLSSQKVRQSIRSVKSESCLLDALDQKTVLGDGQFGEVWLVSATCDGESESFALKVQPKESEENGTGLIEYYNREVEIMQKLNYPFVVELIHHQETENSFYMLLRLAEGGELWNMIHREGPDGVWTSGLTESHAKFYALVIADTLAYMHGLGIIYRDLKPENVLIDADGYPIIADFGCATYCTASEKTYTFCGTPKYLSPEIVQHVGHGPGADHWALGVLIYEMIQGENPFWFEGLDDATLFKGICNEEFYALPDSVSLNAFDIIDGLLEKDPAERLGALEGGESDILKHGWFKELDLELMRQKAITAPVIPTPKKDSVIPQ